MYMLAAPASRAATRAATRGVRFAHSAPIKEFPPGAPIPKEYFGYVPPDPAKAAAFNKHQEHYVEHAVTSGKMWSKLTFFLAVPAVTSALFYLGGKEAEHMKHHEHELEENDGELPPRPKYEHLNWKVHDFPWGPQSLFFNPK